MHGLLAIVHAHPQRTVGRDAKGNPLADAMEPVDLHCLACQHIQRRVALLERGQPLAVEFGPLDNFWPAEEYHQKYLDKHPNGYCHIPRTLMHLES